MARLGARGSPEKSGETWTGPFARLMDPAATHSQLSASFQSSLSCPYVLRVKGSDTNEGAGNGSDRSRTPPQVEEVAGHLSGRRRGRLPDRVPRVLQARRRRRRLRLLGEASIRGKGAGARAPAPPLLF